MEKQVKFGLAYIQHETPKWASWMFRIVLYTAFAVNIVLATIVEIPADVRDTVARWSMYAVTLVHAFSKLFGITVETPPTYNRDL